MTSTSSCERNFRVLVIAAGIGTSLVLLIVGVLTKLQMFGDGSIFSYSIAAQDAWAFHWHNISGRLFSYIFAYMPAESYVALTKDAMGGIAIYGMLHFSAQFIGLLTTFAVDRTQGRVIFLAACLSTALLCPLVFGAPTEMWMAHAVFWPTLAVCITSHGGWRGAAATFAAFLALILTHEGAVVLSIGILVLLFLHKGRDSIFITAVAAWLAAVLIWLVLKLTIRPDDYIAGVLFAAAFRFVDVRNLAQPAFFLLLAVLFGYGIGYAALRRAHTATPHFYAAIGGAVVLGMYWSWFDTSLLAEARYKLRTALLVMTPAFAMLAVMRATPDLERRSKSLLVLARDGARRIFNPQLLSGALVLILLVQTVETFKFVYAWTEYKSAVRALAAGTDFDPALGDPRFVSSQRIGPSLNRLAWNSTTPYLSVLVSPDLRPARLVIDPDANYFWLSCDTAARSEATSTAIPFESRRMIRRYACLHRP